LSPCVTTLNLSGNSPISYSGIWTLESGSATIDNALSPTTEVSVTGLSATFRWTITGTCGFESFDEVVVTPTSGSNLVANTGNQNDTLCDGSNKDLRVEGSGGSGDYSYHWYNADGSLNEITSSSIINVTPSLGTTEYYVEIIDNVQIGCSSQRDTIIIFSTNSQQLVIPNLLTPNGDDKNDLFEVRDVNQLEIFPGSRLEVTNRWGDSVYKNSSYDNSWSPKALSDGLYYYYLKAGCGDKEYKGWVQVVR
jgi:gliding motility-associated-like protein